TRRHRLRPAHHNKVRHHRFEHAGVRRFGSLPTERCTYEPTRSVEPNEANQLLTDHAGLHFAAHVCLQLGAEESIDVLDATALTEHRLGDLGAHVVPDAFAPWRGKHEH